MDQQGLFDRTVDKAAAEFNAKHRKRSEEPQPQPGSGGQDSVDTAIDDAVREINERRRQGRK